MSLGSSLQGFWVFPEQRPNGLHTVVASPLTTASTQVPQKRKTDLVGDLFNVQACPGTASTPHLLLHFHSPLLEETPLCMGQVIPYPEERDGERVHTAACGPQLPTHKDTLSSPW